MENYKAFCNHKINGVRITFPNGNSISTVWGVGTYSDNHDYSSGDIIEDYSNPIKDGSSTAEIMILTAPERLIKKIYNRLAKDSGNSVIGWVNATDWLWVLNQLAKVGVGNANQ